MAQSLVLLPFANLRICPCVLISECPVSKIPIAVSVGMVKMASTQIQIVLYI
jgi:hypothetical protein